MFRAVGFGGPVRDLDLGVCGLCGCSFDGGGEENGWRWGGEGKREGDEWWRGGLRLDGGRDGLEGAGSYVFRVFNAGVAN